MSTTAGIASLMTSSSEAGPGRDGTSGGFGGSVTRSTGGVGGGGGGVSRSRLACSGGRGAGAAAAGCSRAGANRLNQYIPKKIVARPRAAAIPGRKPAPEADEGGGFTAAPASGNCG